MYHLITIDGEQVLPVLNGAALIASKSEPGAWHAVRLDHCDCTGFAFRGTCRHVRALAIYLNVESPRTNGVDDGEYVGFDEYRAAPAGEGVGMSDLAAQLAGDDWNDRNHSGYRMPQRTSVIYQQTPKWEGSANRMAEPYTSIETTIIRVSEMGFKISDGDRWLNWSRFGAEKVTPVGPRVRVTLDGRDFVRSVDVLHATTPAVVTPSVAPIALQTAPEAATPPCAVPALSQDDRGIVITRLAVLNTAVAILSSGGDRRMATKSWPWPGDWRCGRRAERTEPRPPGGSLALPPGEKTYGVMHSMNDNTRLDPPMWDQFHVETPDQLIGFMAEEAWSRSKGLSCDVQIAEAELAHVRAQGSWQTYLALETLYRSESVDKAVHVAMVGFYLGATVENRKGMTEADVEPWLERAMRFARLVPISAEVRAASEAQRNRALDACQHRRSSTGQGTETR